MKFLIAASSLLCAGSLWADQVTLTNGDRITGSVLRSDTKTLVMKTDTAGELTLKWDSIAAISAPGQLYIGLGDGQMIAGPIETVNGKFNVTTKTAGVVAVSKESIQFIRNNDEQAKAQAEIDHFRNPRLVDLWVGNLDLGFAASRGNANTETLTLSTNAVRATTRDKIAVYYTSIFSSSDFSGGTTQTTANSKRGGVAYNLNLNKKAFVFGSVDLESDQFQDLDLRFTPAGGGGYHAIATMPTQLDLRVGAAANREFFSTGLNRTSAELLLGDNFAHKFSATTHVEQKLDFFTNLSDTGAYRVNFDVSAVTVIRKWFSWQFTVSDRYLSNPVAGRKKNDAIFSTGLRVSFGK
jgi:putative salt-induced outer membrane protein YdiY